MSEDNDLRVENAKLKLKVQALNERLSEISVETENKIADLRVNLTLISQQNEQLRAQVQPEPVLEGEVVDD